MRLLIDPWATRDQDAVTALGNTFMLCGLVCKADKKMDDQKRFVEMSWIIFFAHRFVGLLFREPHIRGRALGGSIALDVRLATHR